MANKRASFGRTANQRIPEVGIVTRTQRRKYWFSRLSLVGWVRWPKAKANVVGERGNSGVFPEPSSEGSRKAPEVPVQTESASTVSWWLSLPSCSIYSLRGKFPRVDYVLGIKIKGFPEGLERWLSGPTDWRTTLFPEGLMLFARTRLTSEVQTDMQQNTHSHYKVVDVAVSLAEPCVFFCEWEASQDYKVRLSVNKNKK